MIYLLYGTSDDLAEQECLTDNFEPRSSDEVDAYDRAVFARFTDAQGNGLTVMWEYSPDHSGCWMVGFIPLDEGKEIPKWFTIVGIKQSFDDYSTMFAVRVPDDVKFEWVEE